MRCSSNVSTDLNRTTDTRSINLFGISSSIVTIINEKLHNKSTEIIINTNYDNIKTSSALTDVVSLRGIGGKKNIRNIESE